MALGSVFDRLFVVDQRILIAFKAVLQHTVLVLEGQEIGGGHLMWH